MKKKITDRMRLDWLTEKGAAFDMNWFARPSSSGRGYRLHQDSGWIPDAFAGDTPRSCIDSAIRAERQK